MKKHCIIEINLFFLQKISKKEFAKVVPVISENTQHMFVGGSSNRYTLAQLNRIMESGTWDGGFVEGQGYITAEVFVGSNNHRLAR